MTQISDTSNSETNSHAEQERSNVGILVESKKFLDPLLDDDFVEAPDAWSLDEFDDIIGGDY